MFYSFTKSPREQLAERIANMLRLKKGGFLYEPNAGFDWFKNNDPLEARSLSADLMRYLKSDRDVKDIKINQIKRVGRKVVFDLSVNYKNLEVSI